MSTISINYKFKKTPISNIKESVAIKDKDFKFDPKNCEYFALKKMDLIEIDTLYIIAAIDYVDRKVKRILSETWRRELFIEIPVSSPSFWNNFNILSSLHNILNILTGDKWNIVFTKRNDIPHQQEMLQLDKNENFFILPYSDGLDSYALGCQLPERLHGLRQIRVTSWNSSLKNINKHTCSDGIRRVAIPVNIRAGNHPEDSYRTRPFKFFLTAALVARKVKSNTIYIAENGQGTFGPSLTLKGIESAYIGTHPIFTNELRKFIKLALNHEINFIHPYMWLTKAQAVGGAVRNGALWKNTKSCPLDNRNMKHSKPNVTHCGICSSCLLRRVSLFHAGCDNIEEYYYDNYSCSEILTNVDHKNAHKPNVNTYGMAFHAVESMERLANILENDHGISEIKHQAFLLETYLGEQRKHYEDKLCELIVTHKNEWRSFLDSLDKKSWLRSIAEALR